MRAASVIRPALRFLWLSATPALLAWLALQHLVPEEAWAPAGILGFVGGVAHRHLVPFGVGLFLFFAALARYWRPYAPYGRSLSSLPAHVAGRCTSAERLVEYEDAATLLRTLRTQRMQHHLARSLDPEARARLDLHLAELKGALDADDAASVRLATGALRSLGSAALAKKRRLDALGILAIAAVAATLGIAVRTRLVTSYRVLSPSMLPALEPGDEIAAGKLAYKPLARPDAPPAVPRRGDVILFRSDRVPIAYMPDTPEFLVKRVIGLPGDRIGMRVGVPTINGWQVPSCDAGEYLYLLPAGAEYRFHGRLRVEFLEDRVYMTVQAPAAQTFTEPYDVRPGEVFVLGDNRNNSMDSRSWNQGRGAGVPLDSIEARALWFLVGTHRNGEPDFARIFRPVGGTRLHLEGVTTRALEEGVAQCLRDRPSETHPPAPVAEPAMASSPLER